MKKRPILVAIIGYMVGIIWGLYLKVSIVPFSILVFATNILMKIFKIKRVRKFKLLSFSRYKRYLKLIIDSKVILIFVIFSIISNININYQNNIYENTYLDEQNIEIVGIINSQKKEKQYYDLYKVKIVGSNYNMYIQVKKGEIKLEYGDKIKIEGKYQKPSKQRNYKGYDDSNYLKTLKIIGRIKVNKIQLCSKRQLNVVFQIANDINLKIKENIDKNLDNEKSGILKGLLLGDKQDIQEDLKENFQTLNISHILAISRYAYWLYNNGSTIIIRKNNRKKTN